MKANWRRISTRVLIGLAAAVVALLAVRAVLNYTTGRRLEAFLESAKAEGVPLRVRDLVPDCPDAQNAARLWKAAEALMVLDTDERTLLGSSIGAFFDGRPLDASAREALDRITARNRQTLDLLIAAADLPCFRYRNWSTVVYDPGIPHAVNLIQASRLLAVDAVLLADRGDLGRALLECRAGMRFTEKLLDEPVLLDALIALAVRRVFQISFVRIAAEHNLDAAALSAWAGEMDPGSWRGRFFRCLPGERALELEIYAEALKGQRAAIKDLYGVGFGHLAYAWLTRPLLRAQVLWDLRGFADLEQVSLKPFFEQREWEAAHIRDEASLSWREKILGRLLPNVGAMFMKEATLEAMMLTARVGLASRLYRIKTGHWPASLEALAPGLLPDVPIDPFTGKLLVFRIENGAPLVYSLGSNQKDDGGRGTLQITQMVMEKDDDWSWIERIR